jgi:hypothetical protein
MHTRHAIVCKSWQLLGNELSNKSPSSLPHYSKKPLFATTWQKVLTPKTLAYCQYWQLLGNELSNKSPSSLPHYSKKIYKVILYKSNLLLFLQNVASAGLQKHGG